MSLARTVTVLYPGAMGSAVARLLTDDGWLAYSCLAGRSARTRAAADRAGVQNVATLDEAIARTALVLSLVPQEAVLETAAAFAAAAARTEHRPLYLDANSVAPATMTRVRTIVEGVGAECVDGAFVGPDVMLGGRTTLFLSGPKAALLVQALGGVFQARTLGIEVGHASALKLAFAGFNKGLVALFLEAIAGADRIGRRDELLSCLRDFYGGTVETVERLLPTYPRHAGRRVEEMRELERWLQDVGQESAMATAAATVLERFARLALEQDRPWDFDRVVDVCCERRFLSREG